jgi:RHS repeat-associated protein
VNYLYNAFDTRVQAGTTNYLRSGPAVTDPLLSDGSATYTPGISQFRNGTSTFDLQDRLGNATYQTNTAGTVTATRAYDPFGILQSPSGAVGPFGFAGGYGYQEDADSGLKLLGHRYFDASTGRFLTRDPAMDGGNWFTYCDSNPLIGFDRTGLQKFVLPENPNELPDIFKEVLGHGWGDRVSKIPAARWGTRTRFRSAK